MDELFFMLVVYRLENDPKQYEIEQRANVDRWMIRNYRELNRTLRRDDKVLGYSAVIYRSYIVSSPKGKKRLRWGIILEESKNVAWLNLDKINPTF